MSVLFKFSLSRILVCMALGGLLFTLGCAKGQVKVSETQEQIQKIYALLSDLQTSYAKKDLTTLRSLFAPTFQEQQPDLFPQIQKALEEADQLHLDLTIDVIQIDREKITVLLHWDHHIRSGGNTFQSRGNTTLQLQKGEALQVVAIEGDNPFVPASRIPVRQSTQESST